MKKQIHFILIAITSIGLALFGCNKTENIHRTDINSIVLIFDTVKANYDTLFYSNGGQMVTYAPILTFKSELQGEYLDPIMKIKTDTIVLKTQSEHLFIYYRYNPISGLNFIAKRGDTIIINEKKSTPFLTILNRKAKEYDINYDFWKKAHYGSVYDYSTEDYCNNPQALFLRKKIPWETGKKNAIEKLIEELTNENIWLDSLYNHRLLSEYEYGIFSKKNKYHLLKLELDSKDTLTLKKYLKEYSDSIFRNDPLEFYSSFYWNCLGTYLDKVTKQSYDFKQLFDQLDHIDIDLGTLSVKAKLAYLDRIINNYSIESGQEYYNKFIKETTDTTLLNNLSKKYHNLFDESINKSKDIELLDLPGKRLNMKSILEKHKGKIVYIDFWASWCIPCLKEMPASKKLREKYADKEIAFIYLAINDKVDAWKKATSSGELKGVKDNYLILNSKTSAELKGLEISTIPRYIIYDRNSKIIYKDAPRPSDQKTEDIFSKLSK